MGLFRITRIFLIWEMKPVVVQPVRFLAASSLSCITVQVSQSAACSFLAALRARVQEACSALTSREEAHPFRATGSHLKTHRDPCVSVSSPSTWSWITTKHGVLVQNGLAVPGSLMGLDHLGDTPENYAAQILQHILLSSADLQASSFWRAFQPLSLFRSSRL